MVAHAEGNPGQGQAQPLQVNDDFQSFTFLGKVEGLLRLVERELVRYQRAHIHFSAFHQLNGTRVGQLHPPHQFDRQAFAAR